MTASAPVDTVLQNRAIGFLQGVYPPIGETLGSNNLRDGTFVQSPMNGYQLIPLETVQTGANSENAAWSQGATNCANAQLSSNDYFVSQDYLDTLARTQALYDSVRPMDLLNVASIYNSSGNFPSADLLTPKLFYQLRVLADKHEFALAYNESEPIRAVTGPILANEIVEGLNMTIAGKGKKSQMNVQFGAYAGMFSFFGLANLTTAYPEFKGVLDYISSLTFSLVTNATVSSSSYPSEDEISVRFLFHNGTTSPSSEPIKYPFFGQSLSPLPWSDFVASMNNFSIKSQTKWCQACGNSTGVCSNAALGDTGSGSGSASSSGNGSHSGGGISKAVAGVIGAMVTLAVILALELAILLVDGFRIVSKKRLTRQNSLAQPSAGASKA